MAPIRVNIGSGGDYHPGWVNIDAVPACKPDIVQDLREPLPFADDAVSEVLAQDIIEHFTKEETPAILTEVWRVLKPGGMLRIRVPNPDAIIQQFADHKETRNEFLYGTTTETGVFGAHKQGFTALRLAASLMVHGFTVDELRCETTNFVAVFKKTVQPQLKQLTCIVHTRSWGGAEVFLADLLHGLSELGIQVTVYTTGTEFMQLLAVRGVRARMLRYHLDVIGNWRGLCKSLVLLPVALWEVFKVLRRERGTDAVLMSGYSEKLFVTPLTTVLGLPVVWIEFGPLEMVFRKFFQLPKLLYRLVKDMPDKVIVPSKHTLQHLVPTTRIPLETFAVIPCGRAVVAPSNSTRRGDRIVCVSRLEQGKGQDILIRALSFIRKQVPTAELHIVGTGAFEPELRALVSQLGLSAAVQFRGQVPDALAEMAAARVCVFPSVWELEGFGLTVIEAMAVGTPVVAFKQGPVPEILTDGETGLLAAEQTPEVLAAAIVTLLRDRQQAKRLALAAQQQFAQRYGIATTARAYQSALIGVVAQRRAVKRLVALGWDKDDLV